MAARGSFNGLSFGTGLARPPFFLNVCGLWRANTVRPYTRNLPMCVFIFIGGFRLIQHFQYEKIIRTNFRKPLDFFEQLCIIEL